MARRDHIFGPIGSESAQSVVEQQVAASRLPDCRRLGAITAQRHEARLECCFARVSDRAAIHLIGKHAAFVSDHDTGDGLD
jgi:hypothetical protein